MIDEDHAAREHPQPEQANWNHLGPALVMPISFSPIFWILLGIGLVLVAVAALAIMLMRRRVKRSRTRTLEPTEEIRLWGELGRTSGSHMATSARVLLPLISQYQQPGGQTHAPGLVAEARGVAGMFQALREDQSGFRHAAEALDAEQGTAPPRPGIRAPITGAGESLVAPPDMPPGGGPTTTRTFSSAPAPTASTAAEPALQPGPADPFGLRDETNQATHTLRPAHGLGDIPLQFRIDLAERLEDDLAWAEPGPIPRSRRTPALLHRSRREALNRAYKRIRRQSDLAKALMFSPEPQLRSKGVDLAVGLEMELHELRSRQKHSAYQH